MTKLTPLEQELYEAIAGWSSATKQVARLLMDVVDSKFAEDMGGLIARIESNSERISKNETRAQRTERILHGLVDLLLSKDEAAMLMLREVDGDKADAA